MPDPTEREKELLRRLEGLSRLLETTRRLAAETNLDDVLRAVTQEACKALSCERASLFLYDAARQELFTRTVTELEIREIRLPLDRGIVGWVGRNRQVQHVSDPHADPRWDPSFDRQTGFVTRNILTAPILPAHHQDGSRLLGVLQLLNRAHNTFDAADVELLSAFASHAAVAIERTEYLDQMREVRAMQAAVEAARSVQAGFLPQTLPVVPGYEISAWWEPADAVGGDYYDVIPLPDGSLLIAMADVSGHGLGPSLIMTSARSMLHVLSRTMSDPCRILSLLQETILPVLGDGKFITFLLGRLDPQTHTFEFTNAGHGPAFHARPKTGQIVNLDATCPPVGVWDEPCPISECPVSMEPGDLLVITTDGSVEAHNSKGEMFGNERLDALALDPEMKSASQLVGTLRSRLVEFLGDESPADDVTMLILRRAELG